MFALLLALLSTARADAAQDMLERIDQNLTYTTRSAKLTMTVSKNGRTKSYKLDSFGRGVEEAAVEFLDPPRDKGTRMLKKGDELWMYLPSIEKTQKISGHMLREGLMGSDFSYEDILETGKLHELYTASVAGEETLDGHACYRIELKAKDANVSYPRRVAWVDKQDYVPLKQELYAVSGMLLKTWSMSDVREVDGRRFPMHMTAEDQLQKGSKTEVTFDTISFSVKLEDEVFSTRWLER